MKLFITCSAYEDKKDFRRKLTQVFVMQYFSDFEYQNCKKKKFKYLLITFDIIMVFPV